MLRKAFRQDLYYRLAVVEITLPPLRDHPEDIPALASHLLEKVASELGARAPEITPEAFRKLARHAWPGNVRELRNVLSKALVLAEGPIRPEDLSLTAGPERQPARSRAQYDDSESTRILDALNATSWNVSEVARRFGVARSTLYRRMRRHRLRGKET
jgi:DNA-binding NtrC family response regulator